MAKRIKKFLIISQYLFPLLYTNNFVKFGRKSRSFPPSKGPWIYDSDLGYHFIGTQEGAITGFPTYLINK